MIAFQVRTLVLHQGRFVLDSAGNPDNNDVIEVVSIHGFCSPAKVFASVLSCVVIPIQLESSVVEIRGQLLGNKTKGPWFAKLRDIIYDPGCIWKDCGTVNGATMYISEHCACASSTACHAAEHGLHRLGG